jgi:RNA polymerase sigma-70 factor, ECF subfamily
MDEMGLILQAKQGELDAFNQIVLKHQDAVYNYAYSILFDAAASEDCTQDAFIRAYQHLSDFRGSSFRAWLFTIVRNVCYDELRRKKSHQIFPLVYKNQSGEEIERQDLLIDKSRSVEEIIEQDELRATLLGYLNALPDKYRSILELVDLLDFDYSEASEALNIPMGTVKSRLARGRHYLSRSLQTKVDHLGRPVTVGGF